MANNAPENVNFTQPQRDIIGLIPGLTNRPYVTQLVADGAGGYDTAFVNLRDAINNSVDAGPLPNFDTITLRLNALNLNLRAKIEYIQRRFAYYNSVESLVPELFDKLQNAKLLFDLAIARLTAAGAVGNIENFEEALADLEEIAVIIDGIDHLEGPGGGPGVYPRGNPGGGPGGGGGNPGGNPGGGGGVGGGGGGGGDGGGGGGGGDGGGGGGDGGNGVPGGGGLPVAPNHPLVDPNAPLVDPNAHLVAPVTARSLGIPAAPPPPSNLVTGGPTGQVGDAVSRLNSRFGQSVSPKGGESGTDGREGFDGGRKRKSKRSSKRKRSKTKTKKSRKGSRKQRGGFRYVPKQKQKTRKHSSSSSSSSSTSSTMSSSARN